MTLKSLAGIDSLPMSLQVGLLGKKIGMTQVFADDGEAVPVTVIQAGPCVVVGTRTMERDGYTAIVLGFDEKPVRLANKAELGIAKAAGGSKPQRFIREIRVSAEEVAKYTLGQTIGPKDIFTDGQPLDIEGWSKGKGYQGVIKKHHMKWHDARPRYARVLPSRRLDRLPPHPAARPQGQAHGGSDGQREGHADEPAALPHPRR